jgi:RNA polymerase sigma-70 factor (ECF subfamily)
LDDENRYRWLATHVFPCEGEVRLWLQKHVRTLRTTDHDDVIQEAYARMWEVDPTRIANARGYFYTIVRNLLLEHARRARIVPMERMTEIEALRLVSDDPGPEQRVTARQELENLCQIIASLPAKCRKIFKLRSFEGYSRRQIAQQLGISERTVETHLYRAHLRIDEALSRNATPSASSSNFARNSDRDANQ